MPWILVFYTTPRGDSPVEAYISQQPAGDANRITADLGVLGRVGINAPLDLKPLPGGIWELRIRARLSHRVLYVTASGRRIMLLHAFTKKTQKTPPGELATARRRYAELQERGEL